MNQPAPESCSPHAPPPEKTPHYSLSEAVAEALADLAPTLKEAELRVLLELARRQLRTGAAVRASSRDLANACKASRSKLQAALDSLTARGILTTRQGTTTTAAAYQVNPLLTVRIGGSLGEPPPRLPKDATQAPLWSQGGSLPMPPPTENKALAAAPGAVEIGATSLLLIDRVLSAKAKDFDPDLIVTFRNWLHAYMCKLGRDDRGQPTPQAHPPKDDLVAQFLACGDPRRLGAMLDSLMCDRKDCYSYGWFVTLALQRIHGLHFQEQKAARAALRDVKRPPAPAPPAEQTGLDFANHMQQALRSAAGSKKLR